MRAGLVDLQPLDPGIEHVVLGAGARALLLPLDVVDLQAGAVAGGAPAVLRVVGKQPRVELGEAAAARAAGALGREHLDLPAGEDMDHSLAELQGLGQPLPQLLLAAGADFDVAHRQFDAVLLEAVDARKGAHRQQLAVDAQLRVALCRGPLGELGVDALAIHHQRGQHDHRLAAVLAQDARGDRLLALRLDRHFAVRAVLRAELDEQQPQEVVHFGQRADGGLAAAAAGALLDRHRRRNAEDRVDVGPRGGLDELPRVGIERLEIPALAFGEQDVEGEGRFAGPRHAGHHGEAPARDLDVDALEVVLAGVMDADRIRQNRDRPRFFLLDGPGECLLVIAQGLSGRRRRMRHHLRRRALAHQLAAGVAAFGAEVEDPVGGADDVEVVLDHHQRVPRLEQLAERAQELGDVVEVQPRGRLVEQE